MYFREEPGFKVIDPYFPLVHMYVGSDYSSDRIEMQSPGIYLIEYNCGMFYVGKSVNIFDRFMDHTRTAYSKAHYFATNNYYLTNNTWAPNILRMSLAIIRNEVMALHIIDRDINNEILRIKHMCNDNMLNITYNVYRDKAVSNRISLSKELYNTLTINKRKYE